MSSPLAALSTLNLTLIFTFAAAAPALRGYEASPQPETLVQRIAFGSCYSPLDDSPIWPAVTNTLPDVWVWLGDTIYADSPRPVGPTPEARARVALDRMVQHYNLLKNLPTYASLRQSTHVIGTWDDHDYGANDAGAEFVGRAEAQQHFLDFYDVPAASPRRARPGIYAAHRFGPPGRVVQFIVLDTRYFRSPLLDERDRPRDKWLEGARGSYLPQTDPTTTLLGEDQWTWLEARLREPADLRLIVTSIQAVADDHRFEKWGNFPHERRRLFQLIRDTRAAGVLFLSGDRHLGELSLLDPAREPEGTALDIGYPLYDFTASAMTKSRGTTFEAQLDHAAPRAVQTSYELNRHRLGSTIVYNNFGLIKIDWAAPAGPLLTLSLYLDGGTEVLRHRLPLNTLQPAPTANMSLIE